MGAIVPCALQGPGVRFLKERGHMSFPRVSSEISWGRVPRSPFQRQVPTLTLDPEILPLNLTP